MSRITPATRARVLALLALVAVSTLFASAWMGPEVTWRTQVFLAGVLVLSLVRPADGLLVVAAFAPLQIGAVIVLTRNPLPRMAEAIVLAFLAGWLLRRVVSKHTTPIRAPQLAAPLWIFGAVVLASLAVELLVIPAPGNLWPGLVEIARTLTTQYVSNPGFDPDALPAAALLMEGLGLVAAILVLSETRPALPRQLLRIGAITAVACASLSLFRLGQGLLLTDRRWGSMAELLTGTRLSYFVSDMNAAASYFALFMGVVVAEMVESRRLERVWWAVALLVTTAGFWLTGSRGALAAVAAVGFWQLARLVRARGWPIWRIAVIVAIGVVAVVAASLTLLPKTEDLSGTPRDQTGLVSLRVRWLFLETSWSMWKTAPLLGVGVGQYLSQSIQFMPAELAQKYVYENAHNNFAQVAAELGVAGLAAFLWLLASAGRIASKARGSLNSAIVAGAGAGLVAFLVSALASHPLLVPPVAFAFWFVFGSLVALSQNVPDLAVIPGRLRFGLRRPKHAGIQSLEPRASRVDERDTERTGKALVWLLVAALAVSVPLRAHQKATRPGQMYGLDRRQRDPETEVRYRWSGAHATLYMNAEGSVLALLLRAPDPKLSATPPVVEVQVNGLTMARVRPPSDRWQSFEVAMPEHASPSKSWRVDLQVSPTWKDSNHRDRGVMVGEAVPHR